MKHKRPLAILGDLTAKEFLADYWQKKPLLIKQAIPNFTGLLSPDELAGLACEDEVQSRIVEYKKGKWDVRHGPFDEEVFAKLPEKPTEQHNWTLLVQSVNHHLPEATYLLKQFNFIPHARLDDLMVSYAPDGGGVGPHFDSYDVFLLQGQGKRLWRMSEQTDLSLVEDAPLRILKHFETAQEWLLEAGDMLYLPPHLAHWGIAVADGNVDCMTYSIGFRAPKNQELATEFLGFMQDQFNQDSISLAGIYQDADLTLQTHPAEVSQSMISKVSDILQKIQWDEKDVAAFLGTYLSEPKATIVFEPNKKISKKIFEDKLKKQGIALDLKSQMLFISHAFYLNGESCTCTDESLPLFQQLADNRKLNTQDFVNNTPLNIALLEQLYAWYLAGYLYFE
ncbi:MAG: cupin domain-containing protein [Methylotenera sp.]|nr:cupin domain-containing protein [Methylotenera sp.]